MADPHPYIDARDSIADTRVRCLTFWSRERDARYPLCAYIDGGAPPQTWQERSERPTFRADGFMDDYGNFIAMTGRASFGFKGDTP